MHVCLIKLGFSLTTKIMANSGYRFFQLDSKSVQTNGKTPIAFNTFKSGPETLSLGDSCLGIWELYNRGCNVRQCF